LDADASNDPHRVFAFRMLEGEKREGVLGLKRNIENVPNDPSGMLKFWQLLYTMSAAKGLDDVELTEQTVDEMREFMDSMQPPIDGEVKEVAEVICDLHVGEVDPKKLKRVEELLATFSARPASTYWYLLGACMAELDRDEEADEYLRRSTYMAHGDLYATTLAGSLLVDRHGRRGPVPDVYVELETKAQAAAEAEAAAAENAEADEADGVDEATEDAAEDAEAATPGE
jgi:hypothetical protein